MFNWAILSVLLFNIINVQIEAESHIYLVEMTERGNGKNNDYSEPVTYPNFTGESAHPAYQYKYSPHMLSSGHPEPESSNNKDAPPLPISSPAPDVGESSPPAPGGIESTPANTGICESTPSAPDCESTSPAFGDGESTPLDQGCPMDQELMEDCQCGHFTCYKGEKCAIYKKDKFSMLTEEPNKNELNCKISGNSPRLGNLNDFWVTIEATTPTSGSSNKEMLCTDGKLSCECPTSLKDKKPKRCHTWNGYRNEVLCKCTKEQAPTSTATTDTTPTHAPSPKPSPAAAPAITPIPEPSPIPSPAAAPATIPTPEPSNTPSPASAPDTATTPVPSNKGNDSSGSDDSGSAPGSGEGNCGASSISGSSFSSGGSGCPMYQNLTEDCQCGSETCYAGEACEKFKTRGKIIRHFSRNCTTNDTTICTLRCRKYGIFCCDGYPIYCTCPDGTRDSENAFMCSNSFGTLDTCTCSDGKVIYNPMNNMWTWKGPARYNKSSLED